MRLIAVVATLAALASARLQSRPVQKAPVDRTEKEEVMVQELETATQGVLALRQQLTSVAAVSSKVMAEAEEARIEKVNLADKLTIENKQLQKAEADQKQEMSLQLQVAALKKQIANEQEKTAEEHDRAQAYKTKVDSLEQDITLLSKAWKGEAQHEAALREGKKPTPAKAAPAQAAKAPVAAKASQHKGASGMAAGLKKAAVQAKAVAEFKKAAKEKAATQEKAAKEKAEEKAAEWVKAAGLKKEVEVFKKAAKEKAAKAQLEAKLVKAQHPHEAPQAMMHTQEIKKEEHHVMHPSESKVGIQLPESEVPLIISAPKKVKKATPALSHKKTEEAEDAIAEDELADDSDADEDDADADNDDLAFGLDTDDQVTMQETHDLDAEAQQETGPLDDDTSDTEA